VKVTIEYLGHIRDIVGSKRMEEIDVEEDASVADLLVKLSKKYGDAFRKAVYESGGKDVKSNFIATVNGYLLNQLKGVGTKLKNGDHVTLMPVVSGG
jgi:molybdopterin synthase sulfur carrier subunit